MSWEACHPLLGFCVFFCFFLKLQKKTTSGEVHNCLLQCKEKKKDKDKVCLLLSFASVS
jgi:hypothetical protein